uniref:Uncharacterized protein n=1 Tax=Arundo donax TaxID=35708 RepID=A0A0A9AJF4_ARUDO
MSTSSLFIIRLLINGFNTIFSVTLCPKHVA